MGTSLTRALTALPLAALITTASAMDFTPTAAGPRSAASLWHPPVTTPDGSRMVVTWAGLQKSTNGGDSWKGFNSRTARIATAVAAGGGALYAAADGKLYRSLNNGKTWKSYANGLPAETPSSIAADANFVYVTVFAGSPDFVDRLYRSPHGGANFVDKTPAASGSNGVGGVVVSGPNVCVRINNSGMQFSSTQGDGWSASTGLSGNFLMTAVAPTGNDVYLIRNGLGQFHSANNCASFTFRAATGIPGGCNVVTSAAGVDAGGALYRAIQGNATCGDPVHTRGIWRSTDKGATFSADTSADLVTPDEKNVAINALGNSGGGMYAGTDGGGFFERLAEGWVRTDKGMKNAYINGLVALGEPGHLATAAGGGGIFVTTDGGASWKASNTGITDRNLHTLFNTGPALLTIGGNFERGYLYRSTNGGQRWRQSENGIAAGDLSGFARLAKGKGGTYLLTRSKVYRSTDNGSNWTDATGDLPEFFQGREIAANADGVFVYVGGAAGTGGVFRSTNDGATWVRKYAGTFGDPFGRVFAAPGVLVAFNYPNYIFRSDDNGETWDFASGYAVVQHPNPGVEVMSLAQDDKGVLYLGDEHAGLSVSFDNGLNWAPDSDGLFPDHDCVQRIHAIASDGERIYTGQGGAGVYASDAAAAGSVSDNVACTIAQ